MDSCQFFYPHKGRVCGSPADQHGTGQIISHEFQLAPRSGEFPDYHGMPATTDYGTGDHPLPPTFDGIDRRARRQWGRRRNAASGVDSQYLGHGASTLDAVADTLLHQCQDYAVDVASASLTLGLEIGLDIQENRPYQELKAQVDRLGALRARLEQMP